MPNYISVTSNTYTLEKLSLVLSFMFLFSACSQKVDKTDSEHSVPVLASKSSAALNQVARLVPDCIAPKGDIMGEGQVNICYYNTDSIDKVYEMIVKERGVAEDGFGYRLLKKELPTARLEENFEPQQVRVSYEWPAKEKVSISIQMAGGVDELIISKENNRVKVQTTSSAD